MRKTLIFTPTQVRYHKNKTAKLTSHSRYQNTYKTHSSIAYHLVTIGSLLPSQLSTYTRSERDQRHTTCAHDGKCPTSTREGSEVQKDLLYILFTQQRPKRWLRTAKIQQDFFVAMAYLEGLTRCPSA